MTYICTTCDRVYEEIPEDAIQISGGRGKTRPITYTFPDGSYHSLRKLKVKKQNQPPQSPAQEPKEDTALVQVVNTLAALPIPPTPGEEIKNQPLPLIEPDFEEGAALTPFQLAFRRTQEK